VTGHRYNIISGDSHLDIRADRWTPHVAARWRDRAPRMATLANGADAMLLENRPPHSPGATTITGIPYEQHGLQEKKYAGPGTGSPQQRVREQDQDGVDAELLFTHAGYQSFWRGIRDDDAYRAVIRGYNEWLVQEYCAYDPARLIAMGVIPDTGVRDAIEEMTYCASVGLKGVNLARFPSGKSYATPEDDEFWSESLRIGMPVASHTNGGTTRFTNQGPIYQHKRTPSDTTHSRDPMPLLFRFCGENAMAPLQMAMTGLFDRFPELRIYWSESQAGWLPYALFQYDDNFERNRYWAEREWGMEPPQKKPSEYLLQNSLWGFLKDPLAVRLRHDIGVENLLWGSDFAHATGDWPHSRQVIDEMFAGVPDDERYLMLAGNAVNFYHLDAEAKRSVAPATVTA
jgi:predicted TIM-barrel fold metal-dependent hydrolase